MRDHRVLMRFPVVQVAWVDGRINANERKLILAAARSRGIAEDSPVEKTLADWLDNRPAYTFFDKIMVVMAAILRALPSDERRGCDSLPST